MQDFNLKIMELTWNSEASLEKSECKQEIRFESQ